MKNKKNMEDLRKVSGRLKKEALVARLKNALYEQEVFLNSLKHHCPFCEKEKSSQAVICPCEVSKKYDQDYIDWLNK